MAPVSHAVLAALAVSAAAIAHAQGGRARGNQQPGPTMTVRGHTFKLVNNTDTPHLAEEFERAFKVARSLPCDVPLGSHPGMYNLEEKYAKRGKGGPNPFIDPEGYTLEVDIDEAMFRAVLAEQQR